MSRSQKLILWYIVILFVLGWIGFFPAESPLIWAPLAAMTSYWILYFTGVFKRERYREAVDTVESQPTRADEWKRKLEEGRREAASYKEGLEEDSEDITIKLFDADQQLESSIIIKATGEIEIEGKPPEDIVHAAKLLQDSIKHFGPKGVADELKRQIHEMYGDKDA